MFTDSLLFISLFDIHTNPEGYLGFHVHFLVERTTEAQEMKLLLLSSLLCQ